MGNHEIFDLLTIMLSRMWEGQSMCGMLHLSGRESNAQFQRDLRIRDEFISKLMANCGATFDISDDGWNNKYNSISLLYSSLAELNHYSFKFAVDLLSNQ